MVTVRPTRLQPSFVDENTVAADMMQQGLVRHAIMFQATTGLTYDTTIFIRDSAELLQKKTK